MSDKLLLPDSTDVMDMIDQEIYLSHVIFLQIGSEICDNSNVLLKWL